MCYKEQSRLPRNGLIIPDCENETFDVPVCPLNNTCIIELLSSCWALAWYINSFNIAGCANVVFKACFCGWAGRSTHGSVPLVVLR